MPVECCVALAVDAYPRPRSERSLDLCISSGIGPKARELTLYLGELNTRLVERAGNVMMRVEDAGKARHVFLFIAFEFPALVLARVGCEDRLHTGDEFAEFKLCLVRVGEDSFRIWLKLEGMTSVTRFVAVRVGYKWQLLRLRPRSRETRSLDELDSSNLPPAIQIALYRILQEALTNVARHSGAKAVSIRFARLATSLEVAVIDDGCGFDAKAVAVSSHRLAIQSMRERAAMLGGTVSFTSERKGTKILVQVPLANEDFQPLVGPRNT